MRRISLAVALIGAVAAAGCGGGAKPSSTAGTQGTAGVNFTVTVNNQGGGTVSDGTNTCAANTTCNWTYATGTTVTLTANAGSLYFNGWFGGCSGAASCKLTGQADKYVVAYFSATPDVHPNITDPALHVSAWAAGVLECTKCHGPELKGQGIAPACNSCHGKDVVSVLSPTAPLKGHDWPIALSTFTNSGLAFTSPVGHGLASGHNSGGCARCHAGAGFRDYVGADGTADNHETGYAAATPTVATALESTTIASGIACSTCHNTTGGLVSVPNNTILFPQVSGAGKTVIVDSKSAICGQCHTGVRDTDRNVATVGAWIGTPTDWDAQLPTATNKAVRPHYLSAATTLLGADAAAYAQIPGAVYTARNAHGGKAACVDCHDAHSGNLPFDDQIEAKCGGCHFNETTGAPVKTFLELEEARQFGFEGDIDGDGNALEPVKDEIAGLLGKLNVALQTYGTKVGGANMCVAFGSSGLADQPYVQVNTTDACGSGANNAAYKKFTARSLRASFNYMAIANDPGAWAHNPRYAIEIIYDSIADLNQGLVLKGFTPVANGKRGFSGHFGAAEDASPYAAMFYHGGAQAGMPDLLPPMGFTTNTCYQCHGGTGGFAAYLAAAPEQVPAAAMSNKVTAMQCAVCHTWGGDMKGLRTDIAKVYFPPQKTAAGGAAAGVVSYTAANLPPGFALCATCHSALENGQTIINKIGSPAVTTFTLSFSNPHYLGAATMILGTETKPLVEYGGTYAGKPVFWKTGTNGAAPGPYGSSHGAECNGCHNAKDSKHTFEVDFTYCATCHNISSHGDHRLSVIEEEWNVRVAQLYKAIQDYAAANAPSGACFNGAAYPYWYQATGAVGGPYTCTTTGFGSKFNDKLLKAAFNYTWTQKEPGAWAHNEIYATQVIYDTIVDLGGTPSFTRP